MRAALLVLLQQVSLLVLVQLVETLWLDPHCKSIVAIGQAPHASDSIRTYIAEI